MAWEDEFKPSDPPKGWKEVMIPIGIIASPVILLYCFVKIIKFFEWVFSNV